MFNILYFGTQSSDKKYSSKVSNGCWLDSYLAIGFQRAGIFWWPEHFLPVLHQPRTTNELDSKKKLAMLYHEYYFSRDFNAKNYIHQFRLQ